MSTIVVTVPLPGLVGKTFARSQQHTRAASNPQPWLERYPTVEYLNELSPIPPAKNLFDGCDTFGKVECDGVEPAKWGEDDQTTKGAVNAKAVFQTAQLNALSYYSKWLGSEAQVLRCAYWCLSKIGWRQARSDAVCDAFGEAWHYLEPHEGLAEGEGFVEGAYRKNGSRLAKFVIRRAGRKLTEERYKPSGLVGVPRNEDDEVLIGVESLIPLSTLSTETRRPRMAAPATALGFVEPPEVAPPSDSGRRIFYERKGVTYSIGLRQSDRTLLNQWKACANDVRQQMGVEGRDEMEVVEEIEATRARGGRPSQSAPDITNFAQELRRMMILLNQE